MSKHKEISDSVHNQIIGFSKSWASLRSIAKQFEISHSFVAYIINKWKRTGSTLNLPRTGRPTKISARGQRQLISIVKKTECQPYGDLQSCIMKGNRMAFLQEPLAEICTKLVVLNRVKLPLCGLIFGEVLN